MKLKPEKEDNEVIVHLMNLLQVTTSCLYIFSLFKLLLDIGLLSLHYLF